ncbi:hypothetical protein F6Q07_15280 [Pectobacterium parmentieri]|uniref:Membrane protein n=1 Tax=Pectobacterium parmentieri TaxID=1905730 RepID=A0A0H3I3D7_PECPM|nr:hypothetical protein Pecwa_2126 [Pectobacterium parmentieri WPP163]AFI90160.1 Putative membrane protein [Pectobacterium parmentieri]AOR58896.1 hypothetical protein A8F97_08245 [Pectobacterium parmentieri]AYH01355.1 hypothetical protein C5E26_10645 [Pectobacterium parmentieri]AYH05620.1 hypothetical protein C5E25_09815 [Pectobacterium parmentieri]
MSVWDYCVIAAIFLCGIVMIVESIIYVRRGVYTKTFKGVSRREYIHRNDRPDVYWLHVICHFSAGIAMIYIVFWIFYPFSI